jgi:hypothetical protein
MGAALTMNEDEAAAKMKRLPKVATEMTLHVLAYNLTRVINFDHLPDGT